MLNLRKHNDQYNVVTLFTSTRGRMSFLSAVGKGAGASRRAARLSPLSVIATDVRLQEGRSLQKLGAVEPVRVWNKLYFNPAKSAIAMFLSEFLYKLLLESAPERSMWEFIVDATAYIDASPGNASNLHIAFLVSLLPYAGIFPDLSNYEAGDYFDMQAGRYAAGVPLHHHVVEPMEASFVATLGRMTFANAHRFRFSREQRRRVLEALLHYYSLHYAGTADIKSLGVLNELFV